MDTNRRYYTMAENKLILNEFIDAFTYCLDNGVSFPTKKSNVKLNSLSQLFSDVYDEELFRWSKVSTGKTGEGIPFFNIYDYEDEKVLVVKFELYNPLLNKSIDEIDITRPRVKVISAIDGSVVFDNEIADPNNADEMRRNLSAIFTPMGLYYRIAKYIRSTFFSVDDNGTLIYDGVTTHAISILAQTLYTMFKEIRKDAKRVSAEEKKLNPLAEEKLYPQYEELRGYTLAWADEDETSAIIKDADGNICADLTTIKEGSSSDMIVDIEKVKVHYARVNKFNTPSKAYDSLRKQLNTNSMYETNVTYDSADIIRATQHVDSNGNTIQNNIGSYRIAHYILDTLMQYKTTSKSMSTDTILYQINDRLQHIASEDEKHILRQQRIKTELTQTDSYGMLTVDYQSVKCLNITTLPTDADSVIIRVGPLRLPESNLTDYQTRVKRVQLLDNYKYRFNTREDYSYTLAPATGIDNIMDKIKTAMVAFVDTYEKATAVDNLYAKTQVLNQKDASDIFTDAEKWNQAFSGIGTQDNEHKPSIYKSVKKIVDASK